MDFATKLILHDLQRTISRRGLEERGKVQKFIDSEVLRLSDPYIPFDTGELKSSGARHTKVGSGKVVWRTPYARKMYYNPRYKFKGAPARGAYWFERCKANHRRDILKGAANLVGGTYK